MTNYTTEKNSYEKLDNLRKLASLVVKAKKKLPTMNSKEAKEWAEKLAQQMTAVND